MPSMRISADPIPDRNAVPYRNVLGWPQSYDFVLSVNVLRSIGRGLTTVSTRT